MSEPPSPIGRPPAKVIVLMAAARTMAVATADFELESDVFALRHIPSRFAVGRWRRSTIAGKAPYRLSAEGMRSK
jgi:hypothetical protein